MNLGRNCWLFWLALLQCCYQQVAAVTDAKSYKGAHLQEVRANLENLFGFDFKGRAPVNRSQIVVPAELIKLYEAQTGLKFATTSFKKRAPTLTTANTVRIFYHSESPIDSRFKSSNKFRLKFDTKLPVKEQLQLGELTLQRLPLPDAEESHHHVRILVEEIVKPGRKSKQQEPVKRLIESKLLNVTRDTAIKLDVTEAVHRWIKDPKTNHGLLVTIVDKSKRRHVRLRRDTESQDEWKKIQPMLFTYTDDNRNSPKDNLTPAERILRTKRAAKRVGRKKEVNMECMRHAMHVDFTEVGWSDWIVAPPGYDAFFCYGECRFPLADHLNTTNHAIVQTLMNSMSPTTVPKTCCVPTQLSSISMLYLDVDNKVVLKNYREMMVIGCGCR